MFALPFTTRKRHKTLFEHRPEQTDAIVPEILAKKHNIPYIPCRSDGDIDNSCDLYLVLGAGILSEKCIEGKKIINCHPGIIPACRGLDSFKWAIYDMKPLGITLHYIDARIDAGEIVAVIPTNIYKTDSLATLSRRHYENEINCISNFVYFLKNPQNPFSSIEASESRRRMSIEKERELVRRFSDYTDAFG
jgi:phosphoribosylglycinamide formyltransferase-1